MSAVKSFQESAIMTAHEREIMVALACRLQETELVLGKSTETTRLLVQVDKLIPGELKEVECHVPLPSLLKHYKVEIETRRKSCLTKFFGCFIRSRHDRSPEVHSIDITFSGISPGHMSAEIWAYSCLSSETILLIVEKALGGIYCRKNNINIVRVEMSAD